MRKENKMLKDTRRRLETSDARFLLGRHDTNAVFILRSETETVLSKDEELAMTFIVPIQCYWLRCISHVFFTDIGAVLAIQWAQKALFYKLHGIILIFNK
jgi:hypothetical protein